MIKPLKMAISGYFMCFPRTFVPGPPVCSSLLCRCSSPWLRTPERSNWGWVSIVHGRTRDRLFHPWWQHPSGRRDRYDITEIQLDPSLPGYEHLKCCLFSVDTVIYLFTSYAHNKTMCKVGFVKHLCWAKASPTLRTQLWVTGRGDSGFG